MTQDAPPLTAKQEQGARSREEIIDAAERLMGAHGYAATSISMLSKESGLPASSIYWHFGSKSGVLGAVMERGSRRFFAATDVSLITAQDHPRDRLTALIQQAAAAAQAHPQFLRLFVVLLLGSDGDHAQAGIVAAVRAEGVRRLRRGLEVAYAPWGEATAQEVGAALGDLALAFFDGLFIAGQVAGGHDAALVERAVHAVHAVAEGVRAAG